MPHFTAPYRGVLRLSQSSVLHKLMNGVIKQAATPNSKLWSDKLLHEALYLCGMILSEEDSSQPYSLTKAAANGSSKCDWNIMFGSFLLLKIKFRLLKIQS